VSAVDSTTVTLFYTGYLNLPSALCKNVQNAAAWVTLGLSMPDHVRPALKELHWLPVAYRIQYKVALLMFMVNDNRCPVYLSESIQPVSSNPVRQRLRSASSLDYIVPQTKTKFGARAFSVAGPTVWNSLSESVRSADALSSFKRKLKTSVQYFILIGFYHLFFINIVMPSRSVFVVGWALN